MELNNEYYDDMCSNVNICSWCKEVFENSDLYETKIGLLCFRCKKAIESRGEEI